MRGINARTVFMVFKGGIRMKKTLEALIAVLELSAENLNLEREHNFAIENEQYYDNFIADIGILRMRAKAIHQEVKYKKVEE
jgi:hypothetical protein